MPGPTARAGTLAGRSPPASRCCCCSARPCRPPPPGAPTPAAECPPGQTDCNVWDDEPGNPGDPGGGGGRRRGGDGGGGGGGAASGTAGPSPATTSLLGWFNNGDGCYYKLAEPQPARPPRVSSGTCGPATAATCGAQDLVLLDAPPPGFGAPPDPEELARRALASITLLPPRIAVAPRKRSRAPAWSACRSGCGPAPGDELLRAADAPPRPTAG